VNKLPSPVIIPVVLVPTTVPTRDIVTIPHHTSIVVVPLTVLPTTVPTNAITTAPYVVPKTVISRCAAIISHYTFPHAPYTVQFTKPIVTPNQIPNSVPTT
jgi:hypothetical protein